MKTTKFKREEELEYQNYLYMEGLKSIRLMLVLGMFLYSAFAFLDVVLEVDHLDVFILIRFGVVAPTILLIILLSFHKSFFRIHQYLLTFVFVVSSIGIVAMLIIDPTEYSYYGGLFLVFSYGFTLLRIKWEFVTIGSIIVVVLYLVFSIIHLPENIYNAIVYALFYSGFIVIGVFGSFAISRYRRYSYTHELSLMDDNVTLERQIYENLLDIENSNRITVYSFAKLAESRDRFTGEHIERVGNLSLKLASSIDEAIYVKNNVDKRSFLESIELASTLHDLGKVGISEGILMKPGKLTSDEFESMKSHCHLGSSTLEQIKDKYPKNDFVNMGIDICNYHHENWDGTGYPEGLSGREIPFSARLVAVIDVYDALISERPYKKEFTVEKSLGVIKKLIGTKFDPEIAEVFLKLLN